MRRVLLLALLILAPLAWGADWRPLPSTATHQSQLDLESIGMYGVFTLNRSYVRLQQLVMEAASPSP